MQLLKISLLLWNLKVQPYHHIRKSLDLTSNHTMGMIAYSAYLQLVCECLLGIN
jgi:hypothetical protein